MYSSQISGIFKGGKVVGSLAFINLPYNFGLTFWIINLRYNFEIFLTITKKESNNE